MSMFDDPTVTRAKEPSYEEELREARAWGYETVGEFYAAMEEAAVQAEAELGEPLK